MILSTFVECLIICKCHSNKLCMKHHSCLLTVRFYGKVKKDTNKERSHDVQTCFRWTHMCWTHYWNPSGDPTSGHISIQSHFLPIVTHTVYLLPTHYAMISQSSCSCERDPIYLLCGSLCPLSMPLDIIFGVRHSEKDIFSSLITIIIWAIMILFM